MARTNNLTNFLTDVAGAIKEKKGSETDILAANFDTEIRNLPSQGTYQEKSVTIYANGTQTIEPDAGYDAISELEVTTQVPDKQLQTKNYSFTTNANVELEPDTGYDGFSKVGLEINVPSGGTDTSDATATANDILAPETAYVKGQKITGRITTQYETISSGLDVNNVSYNYRILSINEEAEICIVGSLGTTNDIYIYKFTNSQVGALLCTISPVSLNKEDKTYSYLRYALIAPKKNIDNTINMVVDINNNNQAYIGHIVFKYDLTNNVVLMDTRASLYVGSGGRDEYRINQPIIFNPIDPFVIAISQLVAKNEAYGYFWIWKYVPETASFTELTNNLGQNYGSTNQNCLIPEWSQDGRYLLITSGKFFPTRNVVFDTGVTNSQLTRIWGANNTVPCCMWKEGYWFYGNQLKNSSNTTVKTYSNVSVTNGNSCIWTIKNYWIVWNRDSYITVYQIDTTTFNITQVAQVSAFQYYNDIEYSGTPYCPTTNYGNYVLSSGNAGYYFEELNSYKKIISATMYGSNLYNTSDADAVVSDILSGKIAYNSTGKITGSMPNNGTLNYTPSTSSQSIPAGYTSGGTIAAISPAIEPNLLTQNIVYGKSIFGVNGSAINTNASVTTEIEPLDSATGLSIKLKNTQGQELTPVNNYYTITTRPTTIEVYQAGTKVDETIYDVTRSGNLKIEAGNYILAAYDDYANEHLDLINDGISTTISNQTGTLTFPEKDGAKVLYTPDSAWLQYDVSSAMSIYTVEFDFYKDGNAAYSRVIGVNGPNYEIEVKGSSNQIYWGTGYNGGWIQNAWNKVKLVKDSSSSASVKLYINNNLIATRDYSGALTSIWVGRGQSNNNYFTGWYRNFKIYTVASTPSSPLEVTFEDTSISQQEYEQLQEQVLDLLGGEVSL